ncbi:MAG: hypothetical protein QF615_13200, partial [Planctomycetota bacterium]|nr:hypothetical protein [Planctomycetota bacterium]
MSRDHSESEDTPTARPSASGPPAHRAMAPAQGEDSSGPVFFCATRRPCLERALVLRAVGLPFELVRVAAGWELIVPAASLERAGRELTEWERENLHWPPPKVKWTPRSAGGTGALIYAIAIMG